MGDVNKLQLYERMKTMGAAPPDVLRINQKYMGEHHIVNIVGGIITSTVPKRRASTFRRMIAVTTSHGRTSNIRISTAQPRHQRCRPLMRMPSSTTGGQCKASHTLPSNPGNFQLGSPRPAPKPRACGNGASRPPPKQWWILDTLDNP